MITKKGLLNLVTCYNDEFSSMARHACRTISHDRIFVNAVELRTKATGVMGPTWHVFLRKKVELLKNLLDLSEDGDVVGMFDCDIQVFRVQSIIDVWEQMKSSEYSYVGLTEGCCGDGMVMASAAQKAEQANKLRGRLIYEPSGGDTNTGFVLLKKCKESCDLLDDVLSKNFREKHFGDQTAINESLGHLGTKKAFMNPCVFALGCCGFNQGAALHHATCAFCFEDKMNQMDEFRKSMGLDSILWEDSLFGPSCQNHQSKKILYL